MRDNKIENSSDDGWIVVADERLTLLARRCLAAQKRAAARLTRPEVRLHADEVSALLDEARQAARLRGVVADLETRIERAETVMQEHEDAMRYYGSTMRPPRYDLIEMGKVRAALAAGSGDGREAPTEERALTVKGAHRWDVCPDRANCWAREIHDKYHPLPARSLHREG